MNWLNRLISLLLILTLGFLLGIMGFSVWDKVPTPVNRLTWSPEAQWIAPQEPSYSFYARSTFYVPNTVTAGWLLLSADNDFILYVNGQEVGSERSIYNNSSGLSSQLSDRFQNFNDSAPYRTQSVGNFLLASPRDWKLSFYIDLTSLVHSGKNTIALEISKAQKNPRMVVEGVVYPVPELSPINLTTGVTSWKVSNLFENRQGVLWFEPNFPDDNWREAKAIGSVQEATYSRLSQNLFDRYLQGNWIKGTESPQGETWLRGSWQVPQMPQRAFIRFAGNGEYSLLINGVLVNSYGASDGKLLHMHEVTNFLKTGINTLAVRLAGSLDPDWSSAIGNSASSNGFHNFFLDGWVETDQGNITATIATDSTWSSLAAPVSGWAEGIGQGQPASIVRLPNPQEFKRIFEGNAYLLNYPDYLWHQSLWCLGGIACTLIYALIVGRLWLGHQDSWWDSFGAGAALLLPGTLFLVGIGLLKHRYAEAERGLLFAQPQSNSLILVGFVSIMLVTLLGSQTRHSICILPRWGLWFLFGLIACVGLGLAAGWSFLIIFLVVAAIVALTLLWRRGRGQLKDVYPVLEHAWAVWGQWFLLVLIVGIGFSLRFYDLGFVGLDWDENVSLDATRGILRTGAPEATAGNWYTRGPVYHYMLALWLWLLGDSVVNARLLSALWGTATLVLIHMFTREITGKVWLALLVTAILAIDPFELFYSRNIRFYQVVQFMTILVFWSFCKGFIDRSGRQYQYIFFLAYILLLLNQEVNFTLAPCFLIGFLYFYRPFSLLKDWPIVLGSLLTFVIYVYDAIFFTVKTLTPLEGQSSRTAALIKFHLSDLTDFISMLLVGYSRGYTLYSFFFFLGFLYFLNSRSGKLIFLFSSIWLTLIILTVMSGASNPRYTYGIYSLFVILALYSAVCLMESIGQRLLSYLHGLLPIKSIALSCVIGLLVSNIEPNRVLSAYQDAINVRNNELLEYVNKNRQPGDVVISNTPSAAAVSLGKLDYHLSQTATVEFGNLYLRDGRLIDRAAGSKEITNRDQMILVMSHASRIWIHLDLGRGTGSDPVLSNFIQISGQTVKESFGSRLRLWQRGDGLLPRVPNEGKDLGDY